MRLLAEQRLGADFLNSVRPPSTYKDEQEMNNSMPVQKSPQVTTDYNMDSADNPGNTGFVPSPDNEKLLEEGQDELLGRQGRLIADLDGPPAGSVTDDVYPDGMGIAGTVEKIAARLIKNSPYFKE